MYAELLLVRMHSSSAPQFYMRGSSSRSYGLEYARPVEDIEVDTAVSDTYYMQIESVDRASLESNTESSLHVLCMHRHAIQKCQGNSLARKCQCYKTSRPRFHETSGI